MRARSAAAALTSLLLAAALLVVPQLGRGTVTEAVTPAQAAAELASVATTTRAAAAQGFELRAQDGVRSWTQLFDPVRRTLLTSADDGRLVLDTPDAEFTPLDRAATTQSVLSQVPGKERASWSYVYDPGNPSYAPALPSLVSRAWAAADPTDGTRTPVTVIDSAVLTTREDGTRTWSLQTHRFPRTEADAVISTTVTADAHGRLAWQTYGSQRSSLTVSYDAPTVAHPAPHDVIWTTLLTEARDAYRLRTGVDASTTSQPALPRTPLLVDLGGSMPASTLAVVTSTTKIHWAATTLGVSLSDADLRTHQGDSLVERVLVHRVRPILRT